MKLRKTLFPSATVSLKGLCQWTQRQGFMTVVLFMTMGCSSPNPETQESTAPVSALTGTYVGRLGIYKQFVVLSLSEESGQITGSYFYARHGKPLELSGIWDESNGKGKMTEFWKGVVTGTFDFVLTDEEMIGTWTDPSGESRAVKFTFLKFSPQECNPWDENFPGRGFYENRHQSSVLVDTEEGETIERVFETRSWVRIIPINKQFFAFHYYVVGGNGHQGRVEGLAFRIDDRTAIHTQSEGYFPSGGPCVLRFEFSGDEVHILPIQNCDHFGGARIGIPEGRYLLGVE